MSKCKCNQSSVHNTYHAINVIAKICPKSCKALHNDSFSNCKMCFVDNLLNNKTIILLNHLIFSQLESLLIARADRNIISYSPPNNAHEKIVFYEGERTIKTHRFGLYYLVVLAYTKNMCEGHH